MRQQRMPELSALANHPLVLSSVGSRAERRAPDVDQHSFERMWASQVRDWLLTRTALLTASRWGAGDSVTSGSFLSHPRLERNEWGAGGTIPSRVVTKLNQGSTVHECLQETANG